MAHPFSYASLIGLAFSLLTASLLPLIHSLSQIAGQRAEMRGVFSSLKALAQPCESFGLCMSTKEDSLASSIAPVPHLNGTTNLL